MSKLRIFLKSFFLAIILSTLCADTWVSYAFFSAEFEHFFKHHSHICLQNQYYTAKSPNSWKAHNPIHRTVPIATSNQR